MSLFERNVQIYYMFLTVCMLFTDKIDRSSGGKSCFFFVAGHFKITFSSCRRYIAKLWYLCLKIITPSESHTAPRLVAGWLLSPLPPRNGVENRYRCASAWCMGDKILLTRCSPASSQCKQQAGSLSNESPGELTLLACCLNTFQMPQFVSLGFLCCCSPTQLPCQQ